MKEIVFYLALPLFTTNCLAEQLQFEIYKVSGGGARELIAAGTKEYSEKDFLVTPEYRRGMFYGNSKELELAHGFSIGHLDVYETSLTGFGLWVNHRPLGSNPNVFSWEWFSRMEQGLFKKLQGGALVDVEV